MGQRDLVQCTGAPKEPGNYYHLVHFQNHLVNPSLLGSVHQLRQSGLEHTRHSLSPRGFIQLHNYTTTQLLWGVLEQFVLFDISMVINFWYGYMFIYTSIYLCLYRLPLFKYTHPYRDIEYLSNFFSELPAISELSLTKDITLSQKALPSTLFLHIDKGTSMVVLLRAKPRLLQHTTKNILFPSGTLIFGLLWVTKHH